MYRGTIPAAWADQGPAHEVTREPARAAAKRRSAAARLFEAKRPRGDCAAVGDIIAPPHFRGAPRRFRSNRPSPEWYCANGDRQPASIETINPNKLSDSTDQIDHLRPQNGHAPTEPSVPGNPNIRQDRDVPHSRSRISARSGFVCAANGKCGSSYRGMGADCDPGHPPAAGTMLVDASFGGGPRVDLGSPFFAGGFTPGPESKAGSQPRRTKGQPLLRQDVE